MHRNEVHEEERQYIIGKCTHSSKIRNTIFSPNIFSCTNLRADASSVRVNVSKASVDWEYRTPQYPLAARMQMAQFRLARWLGVPSETSGSKLKLWMVPEAAVKYCRQPTGAGNVERFSNRILVQYTIVTVQKYNKKYRKKLIKIKTVAISKFLKKKYFANCWFFIYTSSKSNLIFQTKITKLFTGKVKLVSI